jgi:hypothetical protein
MSSSPSRRMKIGDFLLRRSRRLVSGTCSAFLATITSSCCSSSRTLAR